QCDVALLEEWPVVDACGHVLNVAYQCSVDFAAQQQINEPLGRVLAKLDAKAGEELRDFGDRPEQKRDRDRRCQADLERRNCLALKLMGFAARTLYTGERALQHWKHFLSELSELGKLTLTIDQLATKLLLQLLYALSQGGLRDVALLGGTREVEGVGERQEVADLVKLHVIPISIPMPSLAPPASTCDHRRLVESSLPEWRSPLVSTSP